MSGLGFPNRLKTSSNYNLLSIPENIEDKKLPTSDDLFINNISNKLNPQIITNTTTASTTNATEEIKSAYPHLKKSLLFARPQIISKTPPTIYNSTTQLDFNTNFTDSKINNFKPLTKATPKGLMMPKARNSRIIDDNDELIKNNTNYSLFPRTDSQPVVFNPTIVTPIYANYDSYSSNRSTTPLNAFGITGPKNPFIKSSSPISVSNHEFSNNNSFSKPIDETLPILNRVTSISRQNLRSSFTSPVCSSSPINSDPNKLDLESNPRPIIRINSNSSFSRVPSFGQLNTVSPIIARSSSRPIDINHDDIHDTSISRTSSHSVLSGTASPAHSDNERPKDGPRRQPCSFRGTISLPRRFSTDQSPSNAIGQKVGPACCKRHHHRSDIGFYEFNPAKFNQDRVIDFSQLGRVDKSLFGVFDGHGYSGHKVSEYISEKIKENFYGLNCTEDKTFESITNIFLHCNSDLKRRYFYF